jgi:hypothetical protein
MAGPEQINPGDVEAHLLARVKLQRVVFGACALVLVTLTVLGISAYREMQRDLGDSQSEVTAAEASIKARTNRSLDLADELQQEKADADELRRRIALQMCRLAASDFTAGNLDLARANLKEAESLGAPPWAPLLHAFLRPGVARFTGGPNGESPVLCGAASGDGLRLAIVRQVKDACALEVYSTLDGKFVGGIALPFATDASDLALDWPGGRFVVRLAGELYGGSTDGPALPMERAAPEAAPGDRFCVLAASTPDLRWTAAAIDGRIVVYAPDGERVAAHDYPAAGELRALCVTASGRVAGVFGARVKMWDAGAWHDIHRLDADARGPAALFATGTGLRVATLSGPNLNVAVLSSDGAREPGTSTHTLEPVDWQTVTFLRNGAILCTGRSGEAALVGFGDTIEQRFSRAKLAFGALGPDGLIYGTQSGDLQVLPLREVGTPLLIVPAGVDARAEPGGFVVTSQGGGAAVFSDGQWHEPAGMTRVFPGGGAFAGSDGTNVLAPWGARIPVKDAGRVLAVWPSGALLVQRHPNELGLLSQHARREQLAVSSAPLADVALASSRHVAAVRFGANVYVCDFMDRPEPRAVTGLNDDAPGAMALSSHGQVLALARGRNVAVLNLGERLPPATVPTLREPSAVALLFGGAILATLAGGDLAFYETASGRELMRFDVSAAAMCAAADSVLHLVMGGQLRILRVKE